MLQLIIGIAGGVSAIATAIVTYLKPKNAAKINAAIPLACTCICEIATIFLK